MESTGSKSNLGKVVAISVITGVVVAVACTALLRLLGLEVNTAVVGGIAGAVVGAVAATVARK